MGKGVVNFRVQFVLDKVNFCNTDGCMSTVCKPPEVEYQRLASQKAVQFHHTMQYHCIQHSMHSCTVWHTSLNTVCVTIQYVLAHVFNKLHV